MITVSSLYPQSALGPAQWCAVLEEVPGPGDIQASTSLIHQPLTVALRVFFLGRKVKTFECRP